MELVVHSKPASEAAKDGRVSTAQQPLRSAKSIYFGDTAAGYLLYLASGRRLFRHLEDLPGYRVPSFKRLADLRAQENTVGTSNDEEAQATAPKDATRPLRNKAPSRSQDVDARIRSLSGGLTGSIGNISARNTRASAGLKPEQDFFIVDWYGDDDPANPQCWPLRFKILFLAVLAFMAFVVDMGASVIVPGLPSTIRDFSISQVVADMLLGIFVLGNGMGPLLLSPLSEIPAIGRLPVYVAPMCLFFAIGFVPLFTPTLGGLIVGRWLTGFLSSPVLATGGASVGDILSPMNVPYGLCIWVAGYYQGPGLGPAIVGYVAETKDNWRWLFAMYQCFVLACVLLILFAMPETSGPNILARRAARIRQITGDHRYKSAGEIAQANLTARDIFVEAIIKPLEITIKDPSIAFVHLYVSLVYAFYYLFFAGFPIVFYDIYGWGIGAGQLPYIGVAVIATICAPAYMAMHRWYTVPKVLAGQITEPEQSLNPALPASFVAAASLFCVGWTAASETQWIAPIIFTACFAGANFFLLQPIFAYIAMAYPEYQASLFAANDFFRTALSFGLLMAGSPLFKRMGIGGGYSFTGGCLVLCIPPLFYLRYYGKNLRLRSKFAVKHL